MNRTRSAWMALVLAVDLVAPASADSVAPPTLSPPDSWLPRQSGSLRLLNKIDSTVQSLDLRVGQSVKVQSLTVMLQACAVRPDDLPGDAAAHLSIADSREGAAAFDGWILRNEPAAGMLEHPVYDIQLVSCS